MASPKAKTAVLVGISTLLAILFFGGIIFFVLKARARAAQARELAELKQDNPVEYFVLHTPAQNENNLRDAMAGDKYYQMGVGKNPSIEEMWQRIGP